MDDPAIGTKMIGSHSTDPQDRNLARALRMMNNAHIAIGERCDLNRGDMLALILSAAAAVPTTPEAREVAAQLMEQWAVLLRSDLEVHITAAGNA